MKYILLSLLLTGCSTMDKFVCYGAGTCGANNSYPTATKTYVSPLPQSVITPLGTVIVVRDQQNGSVSSLISVSGGK